MADDKKVRIVIEAESGTAEAALFRVKKALSDTKSESEGAANTFVKAARDIGLAISSWANIAQTVFSKIKDGMQLFKGAAELAEAQANFRAYALSIGKYAEDILEASRRASRGQVDDLTLIRSATKAMQLGVATDVQTLIRLWEIADAKGDQFGRSIQETFDQIVDAIGRGNGKLLVDLGLLPEKMGRASSAADLLAKRADLLKAVLQQGAVEVERLGGVGDTAADKIARFEASLANLKGAFVAILPAITPVIDEINKLLEGVQEFLRMRGLLSSKNPYFDLDSAQIKSMMVAEQDRIRRASKAAMAAEDLRKWAIGAGEYAKANDFLAEYKTAAKVRDEAAETLRLLTEALKLKGEAKSATKALAGQQIEALENISRGLDSGRTKARGFRLEIDRASEVAERLTAEFASWGVKGVRGIDEAHRALIAATSAAGGFAVALKDGVTEAGRLAARVEEISREMAAGFGGKAGEVASGAALANMTPEKAARLMADFMGVGWAMRGEGKKPSPAEVETRFREVIEKPLSRVFNDALVEGLEGGNFFQAFGRGLRRVVIESLANTVTGALFGQSGAISGVVSGGVPASGSGGLGLFGGLLPPMRHSKAAGGGINWAGVAVNVGAGLAMSWLTSPGRLFGGRVVHGAEVPGQAASINERVAAARQERDQLLATAIGLSRETATLLRDLQFWTAGYTWSKSGDGIFSKKTTTYQLDAGMAMAKLDEFAKLAARAAAEVAERQFQISMTQLRDPIGALSMTIADLQEYIREANWKTVQTPEYKSAQIQLEQAKMQREALQLQKATQMFDYILANQLGYAAMPTDIARYFRTVATGEKEPALFGIKVVGHHGRAYQLGPEERAAREMEWAMLGIQEQVKREFEERVAAIEAGTYPDRLRTLLKSRLKATNERLSVIKDLMMTAEQAVRNDQYDLQRRTAAFENWQKAIQEYYAAKLEARQIEADLIAQEKAAMEKAKADLDSRTADILGTMLTHLGEVSEMGGRQVIVLTAGQPDARALAIELRDSLAGANPELAGVLTQFIEAVGRPRWG